MYNVSVNKMSTLLGGWYIMIKERLADAELDIMRVLWNSEKPLKASEITKSYVVGLLISVLR